MCSQRTSICATSPFLYSYYSILDSICQGVFENFSKNLLVTVLSNKTEKGLMPPILVPLITFILYHTFPNLSTIIFSLLPPIRACRCPGALDGKKIRRISSSYFPILYLKEFYFFPCTQIQVSDFTYLSVNLQPHPQE